MRACLTCLACLRVHLRAHLHFKLRSAVWAAGGYPGTWVHVSSYLHGRPKLTPVRAVPRRWSKSGAARPTVVQIVHTVPGPGEAYGGTGHITQQSTSGLSCQATAVAAGGVEGVGASCLSLCLSSL